MLMPLAVAEALTLPALSVQVPDADWLAPSVLSVAAPVQKSICDRLSAPTKVTTTFVLFQPLLLAPGDAFALAVGGVLSMLMFPAVAVALVLPALSAQVPDAD